MQRNGCVDMLGDYRGKMKWRWREISGLGQNGIDDTNNNSSTCRLEGVGSRKKNSSSFYKSLKTKNRNK